MIGAEETSTISQILNGTISTLSDTNEKFLFISEHATLIC